jgi:hypothetical protein
MHTPAAHKTAMISGTQDNRRVPPVAQLRPMVKPRATPAVAAGVPVPALVGRLAMLHDYIKPEQRFVACPHQDVVYGLGYMFVEKDPVVVQVPDFGDRF